MKISPSCILCLSAIGAGSTGSVTITGTAEVGQTLFPYLWRHDSAGWLYLLGNTGGMPVFWDFETMGTSVL